IKAIHVGNVYGTLTKIIYFIACLIATSLPITGTMIWLNKLRKKRKGKSIGAATAGVTENMNEQVALTI
ncbi:MAG: PepSY domain-containing protein, partial [Chitinophagaceae bacterium]